MTHRFQRNPFNSPRSPETADRFLNGAPRIFPDSCTSRAETKTTSGLTLVELLVTISIIALLTSLVFTSFGSVRAKARDSRKVRMAHEWTTALELHFNEHSRYPQANSPTDYACLGEGYTDRKCVLVGTELVSALPADNPNVALEPYLPGRPVTGETLPANLHGIGYRCLPADCSGYEMIWYLEAGRECGPGEYHLDYFGYSLCRQQR